MTADEFLRKLHSLRSDKEKEKIERYFKSDEGQYGYGDQFIGVKMGQLFELAKQAGEMEVTEIEKLLDTDIHEARAGAISIMDKASRNKKITPARLKEFFDLYMRRHDRINNWDLVDLGCLHMTGSYLFNKSHEILYDLAASQNLWERRTAILSTCYFIRKGDTNDTFRIAELLLSDKEDLIHKATGWMLRFAGNKEPEKLIAFLGKYAATTPRTMLRGAVEKFDKERREYY